MSKKITELTAATTIQDEDSFVLEQSGQAMRLPGAVLREYAEGKAEDVSNEVWQNLPGVANGETIETSTGYTINVNYTDGFTEQIVITKDENDYPVQFTVDGRAVPWGWSVASE